MLEDGRDLLDLICTGYESPYNSTNDENQYNFGTPIPDRPTRFFSQSSCEP